MLDPHGEYGHAFGANAEHLSGDSLRLPYWIFNFEEIVEVVFGAEKGEMAVEVMLLRDLINAAKQNFSTESRQATMITVDTPVPYAMGELNSLLEKAIGKLTTARRLAPT